MYEEGKGKTNIDWGKMLIKLGVFAVVLIIGGLIFAGITKNKKQNIEVKNANSTKVAEKAESKNNETKTIVSISDADFIAYINYMKDGALNYFNADRLPSKNGAKVTVSLLDLVKSKSLIDFTNGGSYCDMYESNAVATKTKNNQYELTVKLVCNNRSDYLVTYIETGSLTKTVKTSSTNTYTKSNLNTVSTKFDINETKYEEEPKKEESTVTTKLSNKVRLYKYVKYSNWENGYSYDPSAENIQDENGAWKHRYVKINWSSDEEVPGYEYTGIFYDA